MLKFKSDSKSLLAFVVGMTLGDAFKVSATLPSEAAPPGSWPADQSTLQGVLKQAFSPVSLSDAERQLDNSPIHP